MMVPRSEIGNPVVAYSILGPTGSDACENGVSFPLRA
jgi:hypothetical protein